MAETFTPAVCGGRVRRVLAVALFTLAAAGAAGVLGAALGGVGGRLPARWVLVGAAVVAAIAALREAGVIRFTVPALRRQVPERWRRHRPLVFWSVGYGAILGAGVGTFLPTATFWVACAGAVALAAPGPAALCMAAFGLGRGAMLVGTGSDPIRRLGRLHPLVRPINAAVLTGCVVLLLPAAAVGAAAPPALPSGVSDPSVSNGVIAYTDQANGATNVVVLVTGAAPIVFPAAKSPSINGSRLAYADAAGIRVVDWRTGQEVFREAGTVGRPSLSGTRLAFVKRTGARSRLVVRDLVTGRSRLVAAVGPGVDLGRPSLVGLRIAWHEGAGQTNRVFLRSLDSGETQLIADGRRSIANVNPVMTTRFIAWTQGIGERSAVLLRPIGSRRPVRTITTLIGPRHLAGTLAIAPGRVWVTRWTTATNTAQILDFAWAD